VNHLNSACGACAHSPLQLLFSLGNIPPVNAFVTEEEVPHEKAYPLDLHFCPKCTLVQLVNPPPPTALFSNYLHLSSASQSNIKHLENVCEMLNKTLPGGFAGKNVLEIGSNDGTLLALIKKHAKSVLGVDPAKNLAPVALKKNVNTISDFFDEALAQKIQKEHGRFESIVALNVVAHTPTFISMLKGISQLLAPNGTFMMENAYVVDTILEGQFDTIYHEHVFCFSLHALNTAYKLAGLRAYDAEIIPTQGTSIRVFVEKAESNRPLTERFLKILNSEKEKGFTEVKSYESVKSKVDAFKVQLLNQIQTMNKKSNGKKIIGLGAPARGVVILNYCGIDPELMEFVIDDTTLKQGRMVPGVHIPVKSWEALMNSDTHHFMILSWNYKKEILDKLKTQLAKKYAANPSLKKEDTVLIPFPKFEEIKV
jgi:SAM-dependent methyltransferase